MTNQSRFERLAGAFCLIFLLVPGAAGKPVHKRSNSPQLLRQAETTANQILQQFHKDLDFKEIFARNFVSDPKLRQRAVAFDEEEKWKQFDLPRREHVYVSLMTFLHLWVEYMLIQKLQEVPTEIGQAKQPKLLEANSKPPQTIAELDQDILDLERASAIYRKYFPSGVFQSAQYRTSIAEGVREAKTFHHNVPRIEKGNAKFGIAETIPVYVVRPEAFDYYFIRENGAMKLFYVNILPNFKLF